MEDQSAAIARLEERMNSLDRRMGNLEKLTEPVNSLALSMERLTASMKTTEENVDRLQSDVAVLHDRPVKRWDAVVAAAIAAIVGAGIGILIK